jgi:hypothetical protein
VHPPQEEPAARETVSPLLPLLTNPQADIRFPTFLLLQQGQQGFSFPITRHSNSSLHDLHWYS